MDRILMLALVLAVAGWITLLGVTDNVSRERLERFARQYGLDRQRPLDPAGDGAARIRRYLAVTRRWRSIGLLLGFGVSTVPGVREGRLSLDVFALFTGWFVGALVAEWRVGLPLTGTRRRAALTARRPSGYLGPVTLLAPWLVLVLTLGLAGVDLACPSGGSRCVPATSALVRALVAVLVMLVIAAVQRQVLLRSQPADLAEDVLAADDAVRSQSLRVLSGCAVALLSTVAAGLADLLPPVDPGTARHWAAGVQAVGLVAGWWLASYPGRGPVSAGTELARRVPGP